MGKNTKRRDGPYRGANLSLGAGAYAASHGVLGFLFVWQWTEPSDSLGPGRSSADPAKSVEKYAIRRRMSLRTG